MDLVTRKQMIIGKVLHHKDDIDYMCVETLEKHDLPDLKNKKQAKND